MGCLKLPYYEKEDRPNFLGLWKKSDGSKNCDNYYPFGLTFNSYQRENSTINNFKYNGIEHEDALDLNVNTTFFRVHDPALGRWWQIDPKPREDISVYAAVANNPILYSDPLGDTTRVYSMDGELLHTIYDKRPNQAHFMDKDKFSSMDQGESETDKQYSKRIRSSSTAFIGENTVRDMEIIAGVSNALGVEFGFVGAIDNTREIRLQILDRDNSNSPTSVDLFSQISSKFTYEQQEKLFLFGHTHPNAALNVVFGRGASLFSPEQREKHLSTPTGTEFGIPKDFYHHLRDRRGISRNSAGMVLTSQGFSIYPSIPVSSVYPSNVSKEKYSFFKSHLKK